MDPDRWQRIEPILDAALDLPTEERGAYLDLACAGDADLRAEVEALLDKDREPDPFLDFGTTALANALDDGSPVDPGLPASIGNYRITRKIAAGGMGVVYEALQDSPRRTVAVKVIRAGEDSEVVLARFEAERQTLALMEHPHIARVFDAGSTEDDRPFFVMEYVDGQPVTDYCDAHAVSLHGRLELFRAVCDAVQHAHRKGVIHRDIKPSNVLVTEQDGKPVPKVIDFGISKAIDREQAERTAFTERGQFIGTPEYMSPEQAALSPADVDTRSDVYSLGVLLYVLLVGALPFEAHELRRAGFDEMRRILREREPVRPSARLRTLDASTSAAVGRSRGSDTASLVRRVEGELDWIVLRAMEKEPRRRYGSPEALAEDIRRFEQLRPVEARPAGGLYRLNKFVRRHRVVTVASVAVLLALAAGAIGLVWGLVAAQRERDEAQRQRAIADAVNQFIREDLLDRANLWRGGERELTVLDAVRGAADRIEERFAEQPVVEASIRSTLASALRALGNSEEAEAQLDRSLELFERTLGREDPLTLTAMNDLAGTYTEQARYEDAAALLTEALETRRRVLGVEEEGTLTLMNNVAFLYDTLGRYDESKPLHEEVLTLRRRIKGPEDLHTLISLNNLAWVSLRRGEVDAARSLWEEKLEIAERVLGPEHVETLAAHMWLGQVALRQERYDDVVEKLPPAYDTSRRALGESHPLTITIQKTLGQAHRKLGRFESAAEYLRGAYEQRRASRGPDHPETQMAVAEYALVLADLRRFDEADALLADAVSTVRRDHPELAELLGSLLVRHGRVLAAAGRNGAAEARLAEGYEILVAAVGPDHTLTQDALRRLGELRSTP